MNGLIIIIFGIAIFYVAFKFQLNTKKIAKIGEQAEGVVFDIVESSDTKSQVRYPIIRFVTSQKEWITEQYSISTLPGFFKKGQKVTIIYNPNNPKEFFVKSAVTSIAPMVAIALAVITLAVGVYKILQIKF